jgi:hypothetical protein
MHQFFKGEHGDFRLVMPFSGGWRAAPAPLKGVKKWESGSGLITPFNIGTKPRPLFLVQPFFVLESPPALINAYLGANQKFLSSNFIRGVFWETVKVKSEIISNEMVLDKKRTYSNRHRHCYQSEGVVANRSLRHVAIIFRNSGDVTYCICR